MMVYLSKSKFILKVLLAPKTYRIDHDFPVHHSNILSTVVDKRSKSRP